MKNIKYYLSAIILTSAVLTSCSSDDDAAAITTAAPVVTLTEVGHGGTIPHAHAGEDLHLEAEILAEGKIASVKVSIHAEGNASAPEINATFSDYNGLRNATFHKHIDIPATQPAGLYHLHLEVTDELGNITSAGSDLEILPAEVSGITVNITEFGHGTPGSFHAHAGDDMHIEGVITSVNPIATIALEIHNESDASVPEINATFTAYAGQTNANFHEHVTVPASQPAGHYHAHFTVTDNQGNTHTEEYELEIE